jgi:PleD family two-component response regulator
MADLCFMPPTECGTEFLKLLPQAQELGIAEGNLATLGDQMLHEWKEWGALLKVSVPDVTPFSTLSATAANTVVTGVLEHLTILVVDDDATVRLLLQKLLSAAGHTVHVACDGREGLAQTLACQPHLVITDLLMPHVDGMQLIKSLRQTELGRSIYIIVLTSLDDDEKLAAAFDLGADDYMTKPVDGRLLQARLKAGMRIIREQQLLRREHEELQHRLLELSINDQRRGNDGAA